MKVGDDPEEAADDPGAGAVSAVHHHPVLAQSDIRLRATLQRLVKTSPAAAHNIA